MEYSLPLQGPPGQNRPWAGYYSQLAAVLLGRRHLHPGRPRRAGRTEDRSRRERATGSPHRNRVPDIPRHAGCYLGVDPGPTTASVPIAQLDVLIGGGVAIPPEIVVPQVEQSCGEILRRTGRSEPRPPHGPTTLRQLIAMLGEQACRQDQTRCQKTKRDLKKTGSPTPHTLILDLRRTAVLGVLVQHRERAQLACLGTGLSSRCPHRHG